ncbi:MAG: cobalt-precorrin-5B (C(1))-methyltransferase [Bacteroidaceae bacterium]|nr:cobalt-precorrin-5B (C(1))-methyltransferase [Bacteroidaceae bacterium]
MKRILVFGGTTEGRKTIEALEEAGNTFYYSTKTGEQEVTLHHGVAISGAMDATAMMTYCQEHQVGLLIDAAHPFAEELHLTVAEVAERLGIPAIRFERIFPPRDKDILWINDYTEIPHDIHSLLATTGVQSIAKLKPLETQGMTIYYRILRRESSIALAKKQGATDEQLCYYEDPKDIPVKADAILLKESGLSGGFAEKVEAARAQGMRVMALKRPATPPIFHSVNGEHGLRRMVEKLLPDFYPLHSGLTTGTCATAAVVAATIHLLKGEMPHEVPVLLPNGETIMVAVSYGETPQVGNGCPPQSYAYCIKEAGDDPDVTDGIEIRAMVQKADTFEIMGGEGIGRFTLPGFDYPVGEAAINKAPRQMIKENIKKTLSVLSDISPSMGRPSGMLANEEDHPAGSPLPIEGEGKGVRVCISVPQGTEIAHRTFNPRLGIQGGISIIGVSGIVKPYSEEAFIHSIRKCMEVAKASRTERVVIHSGAKSQQILQAHYPHLPQQAFVEYGNAIGETLKIANDLALPQVTLGIMLGKAVKLAEGHLDTHSKKKTMNKTFIVQMLRESKCPPETINKAEAITLARELWSIIPPEQVEDFSQTVIRHCKAHCHPLLPNGQLTILIIDDNGGIHP